MYSTTERNPKQPLVRRFPPQPDTIQPLQRRLRPAPCRECSFWLFVPVRVPVSVWTMWLKSREKMFNLATWPCFEPITDREYSICSAGCRTIRPRDYTRTNRRSSALWYQTRLPYIGFIYSSSDLAVFKTSSCAPGFSIEDTSRMGKAHSESVTDLENLLFILLLHVQ